LREVILHYFDENGRRIPSHGMRVFSPEPRKYYKLQQPALNFELILNRSKKENLVEKFFSTDDFKHKIEILIEKIRNDENYSNILKGVYIPFLFKRQTNEADLGAELVDGLLPKLKNSFSNQFPNCQFKATLQSNAELHGNISLDPFSRYEEFIQASEQRVVVGVYFPQALQEFDVNSQRLQMKSLPAFDGANFCLSGGMDICAALIGCPETLFNVDSYTPIPIMSSYVHNDKRMILLLKSYGPNLEFWCLSQMLTNKLTTVSEQWTGGLTFYL